MHYCPLCMTKLLIRMVRFYVTAQKVHECFVAAWQITRYKVQKGWMLKWKMLQGESIMVLKIWFCNDFWNVSCILDPMKLTHLFPIVFSTTVKTDIEPMEKERKKEKYIGWHHFHNLCVLVEAECHCSISNIHMISAAWWLPSIQKVLTSCFNAFSSP